MATAVKPGKKSRECNYQWEGKDRSGKTVKGEMRVAGALVVTSTLRRQGIKATKVAKIRLNGHVTNKDITLFTRQLATMIKAGVPLLQAFDVIGKGHNNRALRKLLADIKRDVETGNSLANAFRKHSRYFDALFCNLVAAGETAGTLDNLLERLAAYREKMQRIKHKIKSAMYYPISIIVVACIITAVILIYVIPAFKALFHGYGVDLPIPTLMVMAISDCLVNYGWAIFGGIGLGLYAFFHFWKRSRTLQNLADRLILRLPLVGEVLRKATISRWSRTLSTLFAAGVPLVEALDSVAGAAANQVYYEATKNIQSGINTGSSLTDAMAATHAFPGMVLQMIAIGEESGTLDAMLSKIADFFEAEVDDAVTALSSLIEPLIMVVLGTLIGGIVVAMYLPIFTMGQVVG